jgi:hypothetical protein
LLEG